MKKLNLKKIKIAQLSSNEASMIKGGFVNGIEKSKAGDPKCENTNPPPPDN